MMDTLGTVCGLSLMLVVMVRLWRLRRASRHLVNAAMPFLRGRPPLRLPTRVLLSLGMFRSMPLMLIVYGIMRHGPQAMLHPGLGGCLALIGGVVLDHHFGAAVQGRAYRAVAADAAGAAP